MLRETTKATNVLVANKTGDIETLTSGILLANFLPIEKYHQVNFQLKEHEKLKSLNKFYF